MPILKFTDRNDRQMGKIEIRNQTDTSADLFFFGDIASESWLSDDYEEDKCPKDVRDFLEEIGEVDTLNIHINSGGGSVFGGIAIYNLLKQKKCHKEVWIDGIAASIASVIACAGDVVHIPTNGTFMIHKPSNGYFFTSMNADELRKDADTLDACQKAILSVYMTKVNTGVTEDAVDCLINRETWMIGEEVTEYFDFDVIETNNAVACDSAFFANYKNTPENLKSKKKESDSSVVNVDDLVDEVMERLDARTRERERVMKEQQDAQKQEILKGLEQFGNIELC